MFNHESRWDRHLPGDEKLEIEPVVVVAGFKPAGKFSRQVKIRPLYFIRRHEQVKIDKVNFFWVERNGGQKFYYFSISAGENIYYLYFDTEEMSWNLVRGWGVRPFGLPPSLISPI